MNKSQLKRELITVHKQLCKELGIKSVPVRFDNTIVDFTGLYYHGSHIVINLSDCEETDFNPRSIMAHETRHHYQWTHQWIEHRHDRGRRWKKKWCSKEYWTNVLKHIDDNDYSEYNSMPWEKDANKYMRFIARREGWFDGYE